MAKRRDSNGFTMLEVMLVLLFISIIFSLTITSIPEYRQDDVSDEINNISYLFQGAQMHALADKNSVIVLMDYQQNQISAKNILGHTIKTYDLNVCKLENYGLKKFTYRRTGDTNSFGTVYLTCNGNSVKYVFQILKGRFRIEQ